jgi:Tfp pilus assembly protein PilF
MRPWVKALAVLILCFMCASLAHAQGHMIRGKVRNASGVNMARITVSLETGNGALINQTVTNNEGDFFFGGLGETSYAIAVASPDYNPALERVEFVRSVSANEAGETRTIEITLTPKPGVRIAPSGVIFAQHVPKAALEAFEKSVKLSKGGHSNEAVTALEQAIELFPDYFDAHFTLASELVKQGKLDEAIKQLNEAQRINPKDDRVWHVFGMVLAMQRKYAIAARVFAEAAQLNPLDPQHPLMRATVLLDHASTINPATSKAATEEQVQTLRLAEESLKRASSLGNGKLPAACLQMARLYEKRGEPTRAAEQLEEYLGLHPEVKDSAAIRAAIKRLRGQR